MRNARPKDPKAKLSEQLRYVEQLPDRAVLFFGDWSDGVSDNSGGMVLLLIPKK
jgi:hypothetical protein